jgi:organic hydroperoxide reductase OsmC/OhrA
MAATAKTFDYAAAVDRAGRVSGEGGGAVDLPADWKPEHLLLAGLIRCTLKSLRYHAGRAGIDDLVASGSAFGRVTKREQDDRYAFVEIDCRLEVELEPAPAAAELTDLLAKAERDCFVGASLTVPPRYRWTVNSQPVTTAGQI